MLPKLNRLRVNNPLLDGSKPSDSVREDLVLVTYFDRAFDIRNHREMYEGIAFKRLSASPKTRPI